MEHNQLNKNILKKDDKKLAIIENRVIIIVTVTNIDLSQIIKGGQTYGIKGK